MNDAPRPWPNLSRRGLAAAGVTALLVIVFYRIHDALLPFIVAVTVAFVLDPLIVWLQPRLGGKRWVAACLVFVLLLLFLAGFFYWVGSLVSAELTGLAKDGPKMLHDLAEQVIGPNGISIFGTTYTADMVISRLQASFGAWMGPNGFARAGALGLELILGTFLTLVLVPYLLISGPLVARGVIWLLPPARRGAVQRELPRVVPVLRRYIIGVVVVVTVTALIAWIGLGLIFHVANAALLSLAVGVLEIIPALGPFVSMVLIGLAGAAGAQRDQGRPAHGLRDLPAPGDRQRRGAGRARPLRAAAPGGGDLRLRRRRHAAGGDRAAARGAGRRHGGDRARGSLRAGPVLEATGRAAGRWWPLLLLLAAGLLIWASGVWRYVSLDMLEARQAELHRFVTAHPAAAAAGFVLVYAVFLTLSLPGGGVLTMAAGLLFGGLAGGVLAVAGAVLAGTIGFLAVQAAIAREIGQWHGPRIDRLRERFEADAIYYLVAMRLLPLLPFSLVSALAVLAEMRLLPYVLANIVGVVPPTAVFVSLGSGLSDLVGSSGQSNPLGVVETRVLPPLVGLAILSLLPVAWRHWSRR